MFLFLPFDFFRIFLLSLQRTEVRQVGSRWLRRDPRICFQGILQKSADADLFSTCCRVISFSFLFRFCTVARQAIVDCLWGIFEEKWG
jgi:hypothetical protein